MASYRPHNPPSTTVARCAASVSCAVALATLLLLLAACGPFTGTGVGAAALIDSLSGDNSNTNSNSSSVLTQASLTQFIDSERVTVAFTVTDEESDEVDILAEYLDPTTETFVAMTFGAPDEDSPTNVVSLEGEVGTITTVASSPAGTSHSLLWDAFVDLGSGAHQDLRIRLKIVENDTYVYLPRLEESEGDPTDIENIASGESPIRVGNDAPRVFDVSVDTDEEDTTEDIVVVRFDVSDSTSDTVDVVGFYFSEGGDFDEDTEIILDPDDPDDQEGIPGAGTVIPVGSINSLASDENGIEYSIVWDSFATFDANINARNCRMGLIVTDEYGATSSVSLNALASESMSDAFNLLANEAPTVIITSSAPQPYIAIIPVTYEVFDGDGDDANFILEYSLDGGVDWHPATPAPGTESLSAISTETSGERIFTWDMIADGISGAATIVIRARASDLYNIGEEAISESFQVNNAGSTASWTRRASMQQPRSAMGTAVVDGTLYAIGGDTGAATPVVEEYDPIKNVWNTRADMPNSRYFFATVVVDDKIYTFGGSDGDTTYSVVEVYDPATDTWEQLTDMPAPREATAAAVVDDMVYIIGGRDDTGVFVDTVEAYDPATDTWTPGFTSMPTPRAGLITVAVDDVIYAIGGYDGVDLQTVESYDPATDTWTPALTNMPTARGVLTGAALDGLIYSIGGVFDGSSSVVEAYDPGSNTWETKTDMITPRSELASAVIDERIYVVGGEIASSPIATVEVYVPSADLTDAWQTKAPLPGVAARQSYASSPLNDDVYVIGGIRNGDPKDDVFVYTPATNTWGTAQILNADRARMEAAVVDDKIYVIGGIDNAGTTVGFVEEYDSGTDTWTIMTSMPAGTERFNHEVVALNDKIYVIGGEDAGDSFATVLEYDPDTDTWSDESTIAPMNVARTTLAAAVVDGKIYAIGGLGGSKVVEEYDPDTNTWTVKSDMPTGRQSLATTVADGKIYAIGGSGGTSAVEIYDPSTDTWTSGADMPTPRNSHGTETVNGKIYAIGGRILGADLTVNEELDPFISYTFGHHASLSDVPTATQYAGVAGDESTLLLAGGFSASGSAQSTATFYYYLDGVLSTSKVLTPNDPYEGDTWESVTSMSQARGAHGVVNVGDVVYAIGGSSTLGGSALSSGESYDISLGTASSWSSIDAMDDDRAHFGCVEVDGLIYALGGSDAGTALSTCEVYDPDTDSWSTITPLPAALSHFGCVVVGTDIYCVGGIDGGGVRVTSVNIYDTVGDTWSVGPALPVALSDVVASGVGDLIWAIGGDDGSGPLSTIYQLDPDATQWTQHESADDARMAAAYTTITTPLGNRSFFVGGINGIGLLSRNDLFYAR